jgi:hypothetical protein
VDRDFTYPSLLIRLADSDISLLSEVPAVPPPPRDEKISDIPFGEDGPLLDTNDGGPLHTRPVRHFMSYPISRLFMKKKFFFFHFIV